MIKTSIPSSLARCTPARLEIPLSTVTIRSGAKGAAASTTAGLKPYPKANRLGTKKETFDAPIARKPRTAKALPVAPSAS